MTEHLESSCTRAFARHETFHPRYGWLRKAVEVTRDDPEAFTAEDATVKLGVGKNMVRSIRYWATAAKLIEPTSESTSRHLFEVPTLNGYAIFGPEGADPFLEANGTLWLVHWWMLRPTCEIPVWWLAFHRFTAVEFSEAQLVDFVADEVNRSGWEAPNPSSIAKDVSCLLRTYAAARRGRASIDDILDCPFRNLGLIEEPTHDKFRFVMGRKPGLPPEIVLFACIDWMALQASGAKTAAMSRLILESGSPGRAFRLGESAMASLLEEAISLTGIASLTSGAGSRQLALSGDFDRAKDAVLRGYYERVHLPLVLPLDPSQRLQRVGA